MLHRLNSAATLIQRTPTEAPRLHMYYIGLDVHKKTISYCVKDVSGRIQQEGKIGSTRRELDCWMKTLPQPWTVAMEAGPTAVCLTSYNGKSEDFMRTPLEELVDQIATGTLHIQIGNVFQLDEIVEAHRCMEENKAGGKIVVLT